MKPAPLTPVLLCCCSLLLSCAPPSPGAVTGSAPLAGADPEFAAYVESIRAVDNHSHPNSTVPGDEDADALPLDSLGAIELPAPLRLENPAWVEACKALYAYPHDDLGEAHLKDLRARMQETARAQRDHFPAWVLDKVGTEVLLANRVAMGPGLAPPRVLWVSYVDALMLPLSTAAEAAGSPDREKLFPMEEKLLRRYLADLKIEKLPGTLDGYLKDVVTATLEAQKKAGCVAVKYEAAYLRRLDFGDVPAAAAARIYRRHVGGGAPSHADYKALQDFLFRYIAREAGRLGMAVHIHSFEGAGNYYEAAGADPMLLEPVLNDPGLRGTTFVIIHGGGGQSQRAGALLWKPNVCVDMSLMTLAYPPRRLAVVLREWLGQFPEKVLFGSDAVALGPDLGWELAAWVACRNARQALTLALSEMVRNGEISRARAREIAVLVLRGNAARLYRLDLK